MKKLVVVFLLIASVSGMAFAATTGTLALTGTVGPTASVSITAAGAASTLNLGTTQSNLVVGTATFVSNSNSWTIAAHSTNGSKFKSGVLADELAYTFSIGTLTGGTNLTLGTSLPGTPQVSQTAKTSGTTVNLTISYTGNAALEAATYTDTITITVAAT